jgi:hypothetical protein
MTGAADNGTQRMIIIAVDSSEVQTLHHTSTSIASQARCLRANCLMSGNMQACKKAVVFAKERFPAGEIPESQQKGHADIDESKEKLRAASETCMSSACQSF